MPPAKLGAPIGVAPHLRVTTEDLQEARVHFTVHTEVGPLADGFGHLRQGDTYFKANALCMGAILHVGVPGHDDVAVTVYLDEDRGSAP